MAHVNRCLELANVHRVCMTNSPFDDVERPSWQGELARDERFLTGLRLDPLILDWENTGAQLKSWGYEVHESLGGTTQGEIERFLSDWQKKIHPEYVMISLPPSFAFPSPSTPSEV